MQWVLIGLLAAAIIAAVATAVGWQRRRRITVLKGTRVATGHHGHEAETTAATSFAPGEVGPKDLQIKGRRFERMIVDDIIDLDAPPRSQTPEQQARLQRWVTDKLAGRAEQTETRREPVRRHEPRRTPAPAVSRGYAPARHDVVDHHHHHHALPVVVHAPEVHHHAPAYDPPAPAPTIDYCAPEPVCTPIDTGGYSDAGGGFSGGGCD